MKRPKLSNFNEGDDSHSLIDYTESLEGFADYLESEIADLKKQLQKERIINLSLTEQLDERQGKK